MPCEVAGESAVGRQNHIVRENLSPKFVTGCSVQGNHPPVWSETFELGDPVTKQGRSDNHQRRFWM